VPRCTATIIAAEGRLVKREGEAGDGGTGRGFGRYSGCGPSDKRCLRGVRAVFGAVPKVCQKCAKNAAKLAQRKSLRWRHFDRK
jgi:hypothetical protein